jgi:hypothetical protein
MHLHEIDYVQAKLYWMREHRVWPDGLRYLWTHAFVFLITFRFEATFRNACLISVLPMTVGDQFLDFSQDTISGHT